MSENDSDRELKVTDKRMFTPDGELREEYRHLESGPAPPGEAPAAAPGPPGSGSDPGPSARPEAPPEPPAPAPPDAGEADAASRPTLEIPTPPSALGAPGFLDLLGVLAEPAALYMGDAQLPDGSSAEDLDMARLYIDLLDLLRAKTAGNLSAQESAVLDDLLYRLRLRYVQKRD